MHLQDKVGGAGIPIAVVQLIGEGFSAAATAIQGDKLWVGLVQGVDVAAIGEQLQGAVGTDNSARRYRARGNAVGALHVIAQDAAAEDEQTFGGSTSRIVIDGFWHIVDHIHVQRTAGGAVVVVSSGHRERLADAIGARARWMAIGAIEGIAVADHAGAGVVAGDGQGVAQASGFRLRKSGGDAVADDVDAAHSQVFQAIQGSHGKGAGLG
ncbi:hypothetical protein PSGE105469_22780 [Pseudomonas gessardii]